LNFNGNPNDTTTLEPTLENIEKISGIKFKNGIFDRGYKGKKDKLNDNHEPKSFKSKTAQH